MSTAATDCHCEDRDWTCKGCWARYRRERRAEGKDVIVRYGGRTTTQASVDRMLASRRTAL